MKGAGVCLLNRGLGVIGFFSNLVSRCEQNDALKFLKNHWFLDFLHYFSFFNLVWNVTDNAREKMTKLCIDHSTLIDDSLQV